MIRWYNLDDNLGDKRQSLDGQNKSNPLICGQTICDYPLIHDQTVCDCPVRPDASLRKRSHRVQPAEQNILKKISKFFRSV